MLRCMAKDVAAAFDPMLTGEAARLLEIAQDTLREWDRRGLLKARRTPSGVRVFARDEVERLAEQRRQARRESR